MMQDVLALIRQMLEKAVASMRMSQSLQSATAVSSQATVFAVSVFAMMQDVLALIRQRLEKEVASMHIPQWPHSATAVSPQATVFQARLFGRALRLLRNCTLFDGVLPRR